MKLGLIGALEGLGNGLSGIGGAMMRQAEEERRAESQIAIEQWRERIRTEYELAKERARESAERARLARDAEIADRVMSGARASLAEREFEKFKRDLGETSLPEGELKALFEEHYFDKTTAPGDSNADRYNPAESEFSREQYRQAMTMGASPALVRALQEEYKALSRDERAEHDRKAKEESEIRRLQAQMDMQSRREAATERLAQLRHEQTLSAIAARQRDQDAGSSGSTAPVDKISSIDVQRAIDATRMAIADTLGVSPGEIGRELKNLDRRAKRGDKAAAEILARIQPRMANLLELENTLFRMTSGRREHEKQRAADEQRAPETKSSVNRIGLPAPKTKAEYDALPSGTRYIDPTGAVRIKQ